MLAELRKGRDLATEALPVARRSVLCDLGKLLNHRLRNFWRLVGQGDVDGLVTEAKSYRAPKAIHTLTSLYGMPLP